MRLSFLIILSGMALGATGGTVADLRITEVNPATGQVEVTNFAQDSVAVATALPFSHKSNTASSIPAATAFTAGQSRTFTVAGLDPADSDLWLYRDSSFASAASIISGLKWGPAAGVGNTSVAVVAGIWPSVSAFVPAQVNAAQTLKAVAYNTTLPANWSEGAANLNAFFGTATALSNPLPNVPVGTLRVDLQPVVSGLVAPLTVVQPNDGTGRFFVCDQIGLVRVIQGGSLVVAPMLDVKGRLASNPINGERGLLGLALHPDFATNKKLYTYTSEANSGPGDFPTSGTSFNHQSVVAEWTISTGNPNLVDTSTRRELMRIDQPQDNHNGGAIHFGPDRNLYIALGDGGGGGDTGTGHAPGGNGQALYNVLGKILRIQIDGGPFPNGKYGIPADNPFVGREGIDEIWIYGLRNPFTFSFDRLTGDCYVGDVGQGKVEELDRVTTGSNYGWRQKEGSFFYNVSDSSVKAIPDAPVPLNLVDPIVQYDQNDGRSIIAGYVYRGSQLPGLYGRFVFGDYFKKLFYLNSNEQINELLLGTAGTRPTFNVAGFGQGVDGELYVCGNTNGLGGTSGVVMKIVNRSSAENWELY